MVYTAYDWQISWKGYDYLQTYIILEYLSNRIHSLATTKMYKCVNVSQEKVYYSLAVKFLTPDYSASCTEMNIFGNSIPLLLEFSFKTEKQLKQDYSHSCWLKQINFCICQREKKYFYFSIII